MKHVLVVEDDPQNALLFRKVLERRAACRVTLLEDPVAVLDLVRSGGVDLIVMDVSLSHSMLEGLPVTGLQLTKMLKSDPATRGVPVLLATAHAMRGDEARLLAESGADGYLSKPVVDHALFVEQARGLMERAA